MRLLLWLAWLKTFVACDVESHRNLTLTEAIITTRHCGHWWLRGLHASKDDARYCVYCRTALMSWTTVSRWRDRRRNRLTSIGENTHWSMSTLKRARYVSVCPVCWVCSCGRCQPWNGQGMYLSVQCVECVLVVDVNPETGKVYISLSSVLSVFLWSMSTLKQARYVSVCPVCWVCSCGR